jgi:phosphoglycerol transferase MdoB-like AlkP superfamily enzyme
MTPYIKQIANLLYRLSILLFFYSLCRILFYLFNYHSFSENTLPDIFKVFFFGIRFDYSAIIQYNLLFLLLYLLPFNFVYNKKYKLITGFFFYLINFFLLFLNIIDLEYFKYTGKRTTADIFGFIFMSNDVKTLLPQFIKDFWYIGLVWLGFVFSGVFLIKRVPFRKSENFEFSFSQWIGTILLFILVPGLLFIGARGTGLKPIRIISAARYTHSQNIPLLLNTPFSILHTLNNEEFKPKVYMNTEDMDILFTPEKNPDIKKVTRRDNVVIIILESFSKEFIGSLTGKTSYTPCFDSIIHQSLAFENAYANGKQSIQALPAIFASLPSLMDNPYISSRFSGNRLDALPSILASNGYHTSFFHGGRNGTMGFDEFCNVAGIKHYYGLNEYEGPNAFDGNWGIYDEPFLQFYAKKLNSFQQPFFSSVFTLSSHHPYNVPEELKNRFHAPNQQLKSILYADYALGKFFHTIEKMPWFKNTLFIFVADHTAKELSAEYGTRSGIYKIPIVFYHSGDTILRGIRSDITQQTDIMPSILDYLGITKPYFAFGNSIFLDKNSYSINYAEGIYQYFKGDFILSFDGERSTALNNLSKDTYLKLNLVADSVATSSKLELETKAIIQQFSNRLLNNKLYNKN